MRTGVIFNLGTIVSLRSPWSSTVTTADRLQALALRRRLDQYL